MRFQFAEQVKFFAAKRNVLVEDWLDIPLEEHDAVFAVLGVHDAGVLQRVREAMASMIENGDTLRSFKRSISDIADAIDVGLDEDFGGWCRRVYETNLRQSYNAGRWVQLQQVKKVRPYWRYCQNDAVEHPHPLHASWNGLVLHADDPWWNTHYPANGWGCQCYVEALNTRDLGRMGKSGPDEAPEIEWQDGLVSQHSPGSPRLVRTPAGIDPGFAYAPGRHYFESMAGSRR